MTLIRRSRPYVFAVLALGGVIGVHWLAGERTPPAGPGAQAPEYRAVDLRGDSVAISDLAGEVVLLNVWATWCPPCREEMPSMQRL